MKNLLKVSLPVFVGLSTGANAQELEGNSPFSPQLIKEMVSLSKVQPYDVKKMNRNELESAVKDLQSRMTQFEKISKELELDPALADWAACLSY